MSTIKTNQITTITGTELTLNAVVTASTAPTAANHLCRKDYVDLHSRIGATVSFSMAFGTGYDGSTTFGFTHTVNSTTITFPTGTWTGWGVVSNTGGDIVNFQAFVAGTGSGTYADWGTYPTNSTATNAMFCFTRVS